MSNALTHLRKLHEAATSAPWYANPGNRPDNDPEFEYDEKRMEDWEPGKRGLIWDKSLFYTVSPCKNVPGWDTDCDLPGYCISKQNAQLIAEMRNLLPALLEALEEARDIIQHNSEMDTRAYASYDWLQKHAQLFNETKGKDE